MWAFMPILLMIALVFFSIYVPITPWKLINTDKMVIAQGVIYNFDENIDYLIKVIPNNAENLSKFSKEYPWIGEIVIMQNSAWWDAATYSGSYLISWNHSIFTITTMLKGNYYKYLTKDNKFVTNFPY